MRFALLPHKLRTVPEQCSPCEYNCQAAASRNLALYLCHEKWESTRTTFMETNILFFPQTDTCACALLLHRSTRLRQLKTVRDISCVEHANSLWSSDRALNKEISLILSHFGRCLELVCCSPFYMLTRQLWFGCCVVAWITSWCQHTLSIYQHWNKAFARDNNLKGQNH